MPSWAFFLQCFLNTRGLRPTASREDFYEDDTLEEARAEFAGAVGRYLADLARDNPERLRRLVEVHVQAIKSMAVWEDGLFRLFIDYLPFETSEGTLTGRGLKRAGEASWVASVPRFQQLKPVFLAQGRLLICTGYVYDQELIAKMARHFSLPFAPLGEEKMDLVLEEPSLEDRQRAFDFLREVNRVLAPLDCQGEVRRFLPADLPALYAISEDNRFLRQVEAAQEVGSFFSEALGSMLSGRGEEPLATLYLNLNNRLVGRLMGAGDRGRLESAVELLYVQALLAGGHPLRGGELKLMNRAIMALVEE